MNQTVASQSIRSSFRASGLVFCFFIASVFTSGFAHARQVSEKEISALAGEATANRKSPAISRNGSTDIDVLRLIFSGGIFMIPIGITSLVVVTFIVDRAIGLRQNKLFPRRFRKSLQQFAKQGEVDPRMVYQSCLEHPSSAAVIVRNLLGRIGRPTPELYASVSESMQREVDRAYANVRWLNLSAGIAPLLGLLGTVWGLIQAFHDTTKLTAGQNRADFLAVGIYEALVTTLAGLVVAIPAAVASHYFEGKVTRWFATIEEAAGELIPRLERYEGKTRFEVIGRELAPREYSTMPPTTNAPVIAPPRTAKL